MGSPNVDVDDRQSDLLIEPSRVRALLSELFKLTKQKGSPTIAVHFVSTEEMCELHGRFFDDPSLTDCITLPIHDPLFLGEMLICPKVAIDQAKQEGLTPHQELSTYIIHCFLHLLGYTDTTEQEQKKMFERQKILFDALKKKTLLL